MEGVILIREINRLLYEKNIIKEVTIYENITKKSAGFIST